LYACAALVGASAVAVQRLTDRLLPATLIAFGPRWLLAVPLVVVAVTLLCMPIKQTLLAVSGLGVTTFVLMFGVLDCRLGSGRAPGAPSLRLMTYNVGGSTITAKGLHELLTRERVDIAAIQECPFYDYGPKRFGWNLYYGGDLCLVSKYQFSVLEPVEASADERVLDPEPVRVEVSTSVGRFQLLNVHLETVRGGLEALRQDGWAGLPSFARNRVEASRESALARGKLHSVTVPFLVAGDFNLPVESEIYKVNWGDLRNLFSSCGRGFGHTKETSLYGIRIDHVLASDQWECTDARVLASPYGGDHLPLVVDLRLK
jgi:vancomycin resistance protein VanJ